MEKANGVLGNSLVGGRHYQAVALRSCRQVRYLGTANQRLEDADWAMIRYDIRAHHLRAAMQLPRPATRWRSSWRASPPTNCSARPADSAGTGPGRTSRAHSPPAAQTRTSSPAAAAVLRASSWGADGPCGTAPRYCPPDSSLGFRFRWWRSWGCSTRDMLCSPSSGRPCLHYCSWQLLLPWAWQRRTAETQWLHSPAWRVRKRGQECVLYIHVRIFGAKVKVK